MVHVLEVQFHPLVEMDCASAVHLPETRDSRPYAETSPLPIFAKPFVISERQRPGTDQTHVTFQDIYELRQFINTGPTQDSSDGCNPRIFFDLEHRAGNLVSPLEFREHLFRMRTHGTEFMDHEFPLVDADAGLLEEDRAVRGQPDQQGDGGI